jgi:hypothetical protein
MSEETKAKDAPEGGVTTETEFFTAKPARASVFPEGETTISLKGEDGDEWGTMEVKSLGKGASRQDSATEGAKRAKQTIDEAAARGDDFLVLAANSATPEESGDTIVSGAFSPLKAMYLMQVASNAMVPLISEIVRRNRSDDDEGSGEAS